MAPDLEATFRSLDPGGIDARVFTKIEARIEVEAADPDPPE